MSFNLMHFGAEKKLNSKKLLDTRKAPECKKVAGPAELQKLTRPQKSLKTAVTETSQTGHRKGDWTYIL